MITTFLAMLAALLCRDVIVRRFDKWKFDRKISATKKRLSKLIGITLLVIVASTTSAQRTDSVHALPQNVIADYVEILREHDSTEAAEIFLVPFEHEIDSVARLHKLPPDLLAAFIQEESAFDQWATRYEPHYAKKKIVIAQARAFSRKWRGVPTVFTEVMYRSSSFGLMQPMGQLAREQGFDARYLIELIKPFNSIEQGAKHLRDKLKKYGKDTLSAISAYNQGNNRRKNGVFVNARYVYRVAVAWEAYKKLYRERNETFNYDSAHGSSTDLWGTLWMDTAWLHTTTAGDRPLFDALRTSFRDGTTGLGTYQLRLSARDSADLGSGHKDTSISAARFGDDNLPSKPVLIGFSLLLGLCVLYVLFATQPGHGKRVLHSGTSALRASDALRRKEKGHRRALRGEGFAHHNPGLGQ